MILGRLSWLAVHDSTKIKFIYAPVEEVNKEKARRQEKKIDMR